MSHPRAHACHSHLGPKHPYPIAAKLTASLVIMAALDASDMAQFFDFGEATMPDTPQKVNQDTSVPHDSEG